MIVLCARYIIDAVLRHSGSRRRKKSPQIKSAKHGIKTWHGVWFSGVKRFFEKKKNWNREIHKMSVCVNPFKQLLHLWRYEERLPKDMIHPSQRADMKNENIPGCSADSCWERKEGLTWRIGAGGQTATRDTCLTVCWSWWYNRLWLIRARGDLYNYWFIWRINRALGDFRYFVTEALC